MTPVEIVVLPHNGRCELYNAGEGPAVLDYAPGEAREPAPNLGRYIDLPMAMPRRAMIWTDTMGVPLSAWADGQRVRWVDLDTFVAGIQQYNGDCVARAEG